MYACIELENAYFLVVDQEESKVEYRLSELVGTGGYSDN